LADRVRARSCAQRTHHLASLIRQGIPTPLVHQARDRRPHDTRPTIEQEEHFVANIKSQIKRVKTNAKRTERNRAYKSELRTWIRKFRAAAESGDQAKAQDALAVASKKLDKAVSKGVIHANQAANKKSAMAKKLNSIGA
jgi:small subunit ribosomal protein S20